MKSNMLKVVAFTMAIGLVTGCMASRQPKRGCPSNSASMGAERVLSGEKPQKQSKFKVKQMN